MHYDAKREILYIFDEIYQPKLTNRQAAIKIKKKITETALIRADSAEPKSIKELNELGLRVMAAKKAPTVSNSVFAGCKGCQLLS